MHGVTLRGVPMATTEPVHDWLSDYDIFDPGYVRDPVPRWDELRGCPIAHTERWGGSWLPTRYEDVHAIAHDVEHFSSTQITVVPRVVVPGTEHVHAPPIDSDPPEHGWSRRLLLPSFAPRAVEKHEPGTRALCRSLIDGFIDAGRADAAIDYAQQIPSRVIAELMGIPSDRADDFTVWVQGLLELGQTDIPLRLRSREALFGFLTEIIEDRQRRPRDDFITELLRSEVDGEPVPVSHVLGTCQLLIIAGIDTTWSSIGSALWHLAQHPDDRRRLVADPSRIPTAVEELLRAYSPVTMARIVREPIDVGGCPWTPATGCSCPSRPPTATRPRSTTPTRSSSTASATATSPSVSASTAAPAPTWPAWRCASRSRSGWPASPSSRWRTRTPSPGPAGRSAGPDRSRWCSHDRAERGPCHGRMFAAERRTRHWCPSRRRASSSAPEVERAPLTAVEATISGVCEPGFGAVADAFAANLTDRGDLGARVCVILDGKVVVDQWGGWADRARTRPWTDDTLTNMWSSTKGVVALGRADARRPRPARPRRARRHVLAGVRGRQARRRCRSATC